MSSALVAATLQAALLSAASNIMAQGVRAYRRQESFSLNLVPLAHFVIFTFLSCPPNFLWQELLEKQYPGYYTDIEGQQRLNPLNTARKFTLDQTLGAAINTTVFVAAMAAFKGRDRKQVQREVQRDVWPLMLNGWKVWPMVSLLNFTVVPVQRRILVGSNSCDLKTILLRITVALREKLYRGAPGLSHPDTERSPIHEEKNLLLSFKPRKANIVAWEASSRIALWDNASKVIYAQENGTFLARLKQQLQL